SMKKKCDCGHSSVRHFCWWNKYIATPILYGSASFEGRRAMTLLKEKVLKGIVLRRTKIGRAADLALPPKTVTLRRDSFDRNEMEFYEALYTQSCTQFDSYVVAGTLLNNYAHIFDLLTRLRQAVDHPYLVAFSKTAESREGCKNQQNGAMESQCGICHELAEDVVV
uniref:SNF2 N-terminal domain-containing protein n=1 Tax=Aegilops tauschii subsp. strangulata TaxID=200361 RepID=A0A453BEN3_AEGTS